MSVSPQIPLELLPSARERFEDYIPGPNHALVKALRELPRQGDGSLFMHGPAASGKTHLLNALCNEERERGAQAWYIALAKLEPGARELLRGLGGVVCFDDLHAVVGDPRWEEGLFHAFNEIRGGGGQVVVSSRLSLRALEFALPDLASRMAWGLRFRLEPLGESDRQRVLMARAGQLELDLPVEVQQFLLRRISRDLGTLLMALEKLHRGALADKRRVTVPLARQVLAEELDQD